MICLAGVSGARTVERAYVVTDKDVYVTGDRIWCSAFCLDVTRGQLSTVSSVLYLELHDGTKMLQGAKIALLDGRGCGYMNIPSNLPTGNYRLVAYTSQNRSETAYDYNGIAARTISIFNPFSRERGLAVAVSPEEYKSAPAPYVDDAPVKVEVPRQAAPSSSVQIGLASAGAASVCVSVFREEGIAHNANPTIADFISSAATLGGRDFKQDVIPDYEGEIVRAQIVGADPSRRGEWVGKTAIISAPGNRSDIYMSMIDEDGSVAFYTNNIYGDKDLVCELVAADSTLKGHLELFSPFTATGVEAPLPLQLCSVVASSLAEMAAAVQIERNFSADTLYEYMPVRNNLLFDDSGSILYRLDDYRRFPTFAEVFAEYLFEIRAREGGRRLQVGRRGSHGNKVLFRNRESLFLLDGVPVTDQSLIYNYDPQLVETIRIFPESFKIGPEYYDGIVDFTTYKHNLPSMKFGDRVRVLKFRGVSYPAAYTGASLPDASLWPDFRRTVYWHPMIELPAGEAATIDVRLPGAAGDYTVVVEGITSDGQPIYARSAFSVR